MSTSQEQQFNNRRPADTPSRDWAELRMRLEKASAALEQQVLRTAEVTKRMLRDRARLLARETRQDQIEAERLETLEFELAQERYAIELRGIREVHPLRGLTPLPGAPAFLLGIVNWRGRIVSIIDLRKVFGLPDKGITDLNKVIVIKNGKTEIGILADRIVGTRTVPRSQVQSALPTLTGIRADYLLGLTGERLVILNVDKILGDPRLVGRGL